ncbi:hypothetical protein HNQ71_003287 [Mesorhizobium sangaii]|uniref:Uncharacterized protein n=1 Tax=Mesorhizobium sangaii TaxID=505389 RepID=A0A841PAQ9_9HYPH|nr:hypothetical protein [Mesorhizobium sangaii]
MPERQLHDQNIAPIAAGRWSESCGRMDAK